MTEFGGNGYCQSTSQVIGHRVTPGKCHALFRLGGGDRIGIELENAFDDSTATIRDLVVRLYEVDQPEALPLGAIGLIYPDVESIEPLVVEMVENLDHYKKAAEEFSHQWWRAHNPDRTLEFLVGSSGSEMKVA